MRRASLGKFANGRGPYKLIAYILAGLAATGVMTFERMQGKSSAAQGKGEYHRIVHVYDGDTVKLDNGERVRLIGIDTPESHDNFKLDRDVRKLRKSREVLLEMGQKASQFTHDLLDGQQVRLEIDVEPRDRYQRLLAYLYLPDGTFVNEKIIREGYAYPLTVPPNVRHADEFKQWFDEARDHQRGLWQ